MSSTTVGTYCAACRFRRPPDELVLVIPVNGRSPYAVCRASVSGACFRTVGPRNRERIQLLSSYLAREQSA